MTMKRILITGLGSIGQRHVRCLRSAFGADIEIHAYRRRGLNQIINDKLIMTVGDPCKEYGIIEHNELDLALECGPMAVFITNPPNLHVPTAITAANRGCHLLIEKPFSSDLTNIDILNSLVRRKKLIAVIGQQFRFHPFTSRFKEMIDEEKLGEISSAEFIFKEYLPEMHSYEDYRSTHAVSRKTGGGVILSLNHYIDIIVYLFGFPHEIVCFGGRNGNLSIEAEDTVSILFNYVKENGRKITVTILLDFIRRPKQMEWYLTGEFGSMYANFANNKIRINEHNNGTALEEQDLKQFHRNDLFHAEHREFFALIANERIIRKLPDVVEAKRNIQLIDKIFESLESKKIIRI